MHVIKKYIIMQMTRFVLLMVLQQLKWNVLESVLKFPDTGMYTSLALYMELVEHYLYTQFVETFFLHQYRFLVYRTILVFLYLIVFGIQSTLFPMFLPVTS